MPIKKEVRKKLLALLPKNYRQILSAQLGVHPQTISNALYGRTENKVIEIALMGLAKETREQRDKDQEVVEKLQSEL